MIEAYLQSLLDAIAASPIVRASTVTLDANLIFRYDDTPHHLDLSTFPHHKHAGSEVNVTASMPPDLPAVLREIETIHPLMA